MDIQEIADAYTFGEDVVAMPIGALLVEGEPKPAALVRLPVGMLNRHGLVAGGTGTGKTRTVQLLAEGLSAVGVPVFLSDVKGDLTGLLEPGPSSDKLTQRTQALGQNWVATKFPCESLSLGQVSAGAPGAPIRATVTDFGPIMLARALELNQTQSQSLQLIFSWADQRGLELVDLKDLKATVSYLTDEGKDELKDLGGVSTQTAGVILRAVSTLEAQGGDVFFGEPAFDTADLLRQVDGRGVISILEMNDLMNRPALASAFLMWLLAEMFETLPEVGDAPTPKLVFFFDEAHLLFKGASKEFLAVITQTVKLIRSKGVGIIFITQTPKDVPPDVLGQLGTRLQHALRAFTPDDQKAIRATADTFPTSEFDVEELLTSLGTGEALVTTLDAKGRPTATAPTRLWAPASVMGPASPEALSALVAASPLTVKYGIAVDRVSAYEVLEEGAKIEGVEVPGKQAAAEEVVAAETEQAAATEAQLKKLELEAKKLELETAKQIAKEEAAATKAAAAAAREARAAEAAEQRARNNSAVGKFTNQLLRSLASGLASEIKRNIFGTRRR